MSYKVVSLLLLLITLLGLGLIGRRWFNQLGCEGQYLNHNITPISEHQIMDDMIVGQSFRATENNLHRIDLLFLTYQRNNTHDLIFSLRPAPEDPMSPLLVVPPVLVSRTINAAMLNDHTWHSFTFPPLPDSAAQQFLLTVESPASVDGDAVTIGGIDVDVYPAGLTFLGPVPAPNRDLTFRLCYHMPPLEKLQFFAEQLTLARPFPMDNSLPYLAVGLAYGGLLLGFLAKLVRFLDW